MKNPRRAGFVLAGGTSSRMGTDKALLRWGDVPLVQYVAAKVAQVTGTATLIGGAARFDGLPYPAVDDDEPGIGPLGGIRTALGRTEADWNLIVACDMPALTPRFLGELLETAERSGGGVLVPVTPDGRLQPLCAVYHRRALAPLRTAGTRKLRDAIRGADMVQWEVADASLFANCNTPEDLARQGRAPAVRA